MNKQQQKQNKIGDKQGQYDKRKNVRMSQTETNWVQFILARLKFNIVAKTINS